MTKFRASARPALDGNNLVSGEDARHSITHYHTRYYENELPQPQDLVEFGFLKTKPCCISVSL